MEDPDGRRRSTETSITEWAGKHETFRTKLIVLPEAFVEYLKAPGPMVLPKTKAVLRDDDDSEAWSSDDDDVDAPEFPELEALIDGAIAKLGGVAFPRLNWRSPRDAAWIIGGLECRSAADVFALLKASSNVAYDVDDGVPTLALREWWDLDPKREFRGFVRHGVLVAACQRKTDTCFGYTADDLTSIRKRIATFFDASLRHGVTDIVFDVYLDTTLPTKKAWLVGLKDLRPPTNSLLFDWSEIISANDNSSSVVESSTTNNHYGPRGPTSFASFELRVAVPHDNDDGPDSSPGPPVVPSELSSSRAPTDILNLAAAGGLETFIEKIRLQHQQGDDDDDD